MNREIQVMVQYVNSHILMAAILKMAAKISCMASTFYLGGSLRSKKKLGRRLFWVGCARQPDLAHGLICIQIKQKQPTKIIMMISY